ncbi:MAG: class I SAM-dependent methyltransferase [Vicinamibacterales bacterium]
MEDRLLELLPAVPVEPHVLDLGCGVGGSLITMAERRAMRGTGITLSPVQVRLAAERIRAAGLGSRVTCLEGDYANLPPSIGGVTLAFAIESFVHGPTPERFFAECARVLEPGGQLVIVDDVLREDLPDDAEETVEGVSCGLAGQHALVTGAALRRMAAGQGSGCVATGGPHRVLELHRPRDLALAWVVRHAGRLLARTRFAHVVGGTALQSLPRTLMGRLRHGALHAAGVSAGSRIISSGHDAEPVEHRCADRAHRRPGRSAPRWCRTSSTSTPGARPSAKRRT